MPFNGSGTFTPPGSDFPAVTGTTISSAHYNNTVTDIAGGLTNAITRDGQSPATANIDLGSHKLINVTPGTNAGDAVSLSATKSVAIPGNLALASESSLVSSMAYTAASPAYITSYSSTVGNKTVAMVFSHSNLENVTVSYTNANGGFSFTCDDDFSVLSGAGAIYFTSDAGITLDANESHIKLQSTSTTILGGYVSVAAGASYAYFFGAPSFDPGRGTVFIKNCTTAPAVSTTGGGVLYVESGALKYKGSSGTVTIIAPA